jgi:hypothetical protein
MSTAAIVLCTTLVMNVGNESVLTKECRVEEPRIEVASPRTDVPKNVEQITTEAATESIPETTDVTPVENTVPPRKVVAVKTKPAAVVVKHVRPKRAKLTTHVSHRKHFRAKRRYTVVAAATSTPLPPKKPTLWDRLKQFAKSDYSP